MLSCFFTVWRETNGEVNWWYFFRIFSDWIGESVWEMGLFSISIFYIDYKDKLKIEVKEIIPKIMGLISTLTLIDCIRYLENK